MSDPTATPHIAENAGTVAHRWRLQLDMDAKSQDDLADKLHDLAHDLIIHRMSPSSTFASPSCAGHVQLSEIEREVGRG